MTDYAKRNPLGYVLQSTNAYILKDAWPLTGDNDCASANGSVLEIPAAESHCYTLESPGSRGATSDIEYSRSLASILSPLHNTMFLQSTASPLKTLLMCLSHVKLLRDTTKQL